MQKFSMVIYSHVFQCMIQKIFRFQSMAMMIKLLGFSNHIHLQIFVDLHVIFRWKICLGFGRCMEHQDIQFRFYDYHFHASNCTQKSFSSYKISSHTSSSCLVEDIWSLQQSLQWMCYTFPQCQGKNSRLVQSITWKINSWFEQFN